MTAGPVVGGALGLHQRAVIAAREGRMQTAARLVDLALSADPDPDLRARVLVHRAYLVAESHSSAEGLRLLDELDAELVSPELRGLSAVNRGLVLARRDAGQAVEAFDRALRLLPSGDPEPRVAALINRGSLRLEMGDLTPAAADFRRAVDLASRAGLPVLAAMASSNLGYTFMLGGDIPAALQVLDRAEPGLAGLSPVLAARCRVTRAETLMAAGLLDDAGQQLDTAARVLGRHRATYDQAEAEGELARVLIARDQPAAARRVAARAARRFSRLGATVQALQARRLELYAGLLLGRGVAAAAEEAVTQTATFTDLGLDHQARRSRLLAAEAYLRLRRPADARAALGGAHRLRRGDGVLDRIRTLQVRAALAEAEGRGADAGRDLRRAMVDLHRHASGMGSLELRVAVAVHARQISRAGVERALRTGDPGRVLGWAELTRGLSQRLPPVTPPRDPVADGWSQELRLVRARVREAGPGRAGDQPRARAAELERLLRTRAWRAHGRTEVGSGGSTLPVASLTDLLAGAGGVALNLLVADGDLLGVVVGAGRTRLVRLGGLRLVVDDSRRLRADLDLLASSRTPAPIRAVANASAAAALARLDRDLVRPLLQGGSGTDEGPVLVAPPGELSLVPWGLLPSLHGRAVTVSATATAWARGRARARLGNRPRVGSVSGPGLAHGDREAAEVSGVWPGGHAVARATAAQAVLVAAGSDVFHVAAHGVHEPQNPLFSHLLMADGPLFGHELHGLERVPSHVVLSACELGCAETRPGDERLGMTAALLAAGVGSVVAGVARVDDQVSARVAVAHHGGLAAGLSPALALARALAAEPPGAAPAPFVCFGSGW
ncbi:CHAT domain-containing protein [Aquipuribacter sp. MA13-6]|uniref:CHAT domain-containing protein n=1 Tax=unclassified Aquipuribacter TaxID=2635084 RepID=UPI003EEC1D43